MLWNGNEETVLFVYNIIRYSNLYIYTHRADDIAIIKETDEDAKEQLDWQHEEECQKDTTKDGTKTKTLNITKDWETQEGTVQR